ncbi:unnamed protein product [Ectocarpus sp. 8 AP-2014]
MASATEKIPAAPPRPNGLLAYGMESRDRLWKGTPRNTPPLLLIYPRFACTLLARSETKKNSTNAIASSNLYTAWMRKHVSAYLDFEVNSIVIVVAIPQRQIVVIFSPQWLHTTSISHKEAFAWSTNAKRPSFRGHLKNKNKRSPREKKKWNDTKKSRLLD